MFHAGALGDFVLIWPLLRALEARGREVTVVAPASKAALAAAELGVTQQNAENARFTRLWQGASAVKASDREEGVSEVYSFVADETTEAGRAWLAAARAMFPGAVATAVGPPGSSSRAALWAVVGAASAVAEERVNPRGPIVLHVGAGSASKRWPMERWHALREAIAGGALGSPAPRVDVLAGEVEEEQFNAAERRVFGAMDGRFVEKLGQLAMTIKAARLFIGADSGPAHLAAQLGVPTVTLFGPTDPAIWRPVGPAVEACAPPTPRTMEWLSVAGVTDAAKRCMTPRD